MKSSDSLPVAPTVRNIVALLPLERSQSSVFLPLLGLLHLPQEAQACEAVNSRRVCRITVAQAKIYLNIKLKGHHKDVLLIWRPKQDSNL